MGLLSLGGSKKKTSVTNENNAIGVTDSRVIANVTNQGIPFEQFQGVLESFGETQRLAIATITKLTGNSDEKYTAISAGAGPLTARTPVLIDDNSSLDNTTPPGLDLKTIAIIGGASLLGIFALSLVFK